MEEYKDDPEALNWLRANPNTSSRFASNRFTMEQAIKFVEDLYAGGATRVVIPKSSIRGESIGSNTTIQNTTSATTSNSFTMEEALKIIEKLQSEGATQFYVPEEFIKPTAISHSQESLYQESLYSDTMVVFYEPNIPTNEAMVRMCLQEIKEEGFLVKQDEDGEETEISVEEALRDSMAGNSFFLWWD